MCVCVCVCVSVCVSVHNIQYLLRFHGNSGYANTLHCYSIRTLLVLLVCQARVNQLVVF